MGLLLMRRTREARRREAPDLYGVLPPEKGGEGLTAPLYTPIRSHGARDALGNRRRAPRRDASSRIPLSAISSSESSRATSFPGPSSCGASSRSSSNNGWPGRAIRSKKRSWPMSCTGRERTSTEAPIPSFGWTPGAFATNCASTTRADPIPSSSRCRRAAMCPSSKRIPSHTPTRLLPLFPPQPTPQVPNLRRARIAVSALAAHRCGHRLRACLARTPQAGDGSSPAASLGFISRWGGAACVVPGRQPCRLRLVGPSRARPDGHLCEGR